MTEEQYKRAVAINDRISELEKVKDEMGKTTNHRLWYAEKGTGDWRLTSEWIMRHIGEILDRHDVMIRQEIEDEIKKLKEEIKTL